MGAWREANRFFTEEEQMLLAMTEEITLISQHGLTEAAYKKAAQIFTEIQIPEIIMAIATINATNRRVGKYASANRGVR